MMNENDNNHEILSDEELEIIKKAADQRERMGEYGYYYLIGVLAAMCFGSMVLLSIIASWEFVFVGVILIGGMWIPLLLIVLIPNFKKQKSALRNFKNAIKTETETGKQLIPEELKYTRLYRVYKKRVKTK